jgi:leucyl aminopeptidase
MKVHLETSDIVGAECDLIVLFEEGQAKRICGERRATQAEKPSHSFEVLRTKADVRAPIALLVHLDFYSQQAEGMQIRSAVGDAIRFVVQRGAGAVAFVIDDAQLRDFPTILDALFTATYSFQKYLKEPSKLLDEFDAAVHVQAASEMRAREILERAHILNSGVALARDLANLPPAKVTPEYLAGALGDVAARYGESVRIYDDAKLAAEGYVGHIAVGGGSVHKPRMAVARYIPEGGTKNKRVTALVGKGVTFDSGGIDIKPFQDMWLMKADMSGAAAVIGAFEAICALKPKIEVIAIACCAENMPSGSAYRPSDILTYRNGKSVEIISTDAEGRLVLADGLIHACELGATHIVDIATLTGACVIALGNDFTGLFGNNDGFTQSVENAAVAAGELVWRLPLPAWYRADYLKSDFCDMKNVGGRFGGAITAAVFLNEFVEEGKAWCHLDIAPTFYVENAKREYLQPGATGAGVRLLVEVVERLAATE